VKKQLDTFINHTATEITVGVLIVFSVAVTVMEVTIASGTGLHRFADIAGNVVTGIFVVELSIRWYVARSTVSFFRHYWVDAFAIMPVVRPLRMLRVLRLLRLVRLGILLSRRTRKVAAILHEGLAENLIVIVVLCVVFLIGAIGITIVERGNDAFRTFGDAVWWSLFTMMAGEPIGGEPVTLVGRIITTVVMLGGFTVFAMFTGVVSAVMVSQLRGRMEAKDMELEELRGHYIICGWNRSGPVMIRELQAARATRATPIVIIAEMEGEPDLPDNINTGLIFFVRGDYTSTETLLRAGVDRAAAALLLTDKAVPRSDQDRDARTILAALTIEKLSPGIFTSAQLLRRENEPHLRMAGVEDVVIADEYMGNLIAHSSRTYGLVTVLDELLRTAHGNEFYKIPVRSEWVGMTVLELLPIIKKTRNATLISIETAAGDGPRQIVTNPSPEYLVREDEQLIVIAGQDPSAEG